MKLILWLSLFLAVCFDMQAQNPIIQTKYTTDPAPYVHGDTVYLFTGRDNGVRDGFDMTEWELYTSIDMVNWTDHGAVAGLSNFKWTGDNGAWAPQVIERGGKWFMYAPIQLRGIGVLTADSPYGPWTDPKGRALINHSIKDIDPTVFIDDDGQAYLYWGNNGLFYVKLNEDMISYSGGIHEVALTTEAFGGYKETYKDSTGTEQTRIVGIDCFEEGPWLCKRDSLYYLIYAAGGIPEHLSYSTAPSPTGSWTYRGRIMDEARNSFTIHPGIIDFKGSSFIFYHNGRLPGGNGFKRSVCAERFSYNADGTIPLIKQTNMGVTDTLGTINPFNRQEAEMMAYSKGVETTMIPDRGMVVDAMDQYDYVKVKNVNFGNGGAQSFIACCRYGDGSGIIQVSIDNMYNIVAQDTIVDGRDWKEYATTVNVNVTGLHDVYLKCMPTGSITKNLFSMDYWYFSSAESTGVEAIDKNIHSQSDGPPSEYNLQGVPVNRNYRGMIVVDGKKFIRK